MTEVLEAVSEFFRRNFGPPSKRVANFDIRLICYKVGAVRNIQPNFQTIICFPSTGAQIAQD